MERGGPRACLHTLMLATALTAGLGGTAQAVTLDDFETVVDDYLAERREPEMISGVAAYVSLGDPGPAIEIFAGKKSIDGDIPISGNTLFQIGSITKGFTAALILALEAEGKLNIDQTIGNWLPLYPAWKDVTIRRLLHMTSGLPNYTESLALDKLWVSDPDRHYTLEDLIDYAYPSETVDLPPNEGWFYSNTNYVLAGMIAEKAAEMPYKQAL
jgi:D-alanyl-D-alanine carboxypeptidase